jgi:hypothetical protein
MLVRQGDSEPFIGVRMPLAQSVYQGSHKELLLIVTLVRQFLRCSDVQVPSPRSKVGLGSPPDETDQQEWPKQGEGQKEFKFPASFHFLAPR